MYKRGFERQGAREEAYGHMVQCQIYLRVHLSVALRPRIKSKTCPSAFNLVSVEWPPAQPDRHIDMAVSNIRPPIKFIHFARGAPHGQGS